MIPYGGAEDMVRRYLMSGDVVSLVKQDGRRIDGIEARVQTDLIMIGDTALPIEEGDYIIRSLPSGLEERYQVLDKGYNAGLGPGRSGIPPHYKVKVRKEGTLTAEKPGTTIYNLYGPNSRVNNESYDASVNIVTAFPNEIFDDLKEAITNSQLDAEVQTDILGHVENMESTHGTQGFFKHYQGLMNSLAAHATVYVVIAPYLPALAQMAGQLLVK